MCEKADGSAIADGAHTLCTRNAECLTTGYVMSLLLACVYGMGVHTRVPGSL